MSTVRPAMPTRPAASAFWSPAALIAAVLFGEALAAVLTLGAERPGWVFFGLASLGLQWILLLALGGLYLGRHSLRGLGTGRLATVAFGALLGATLLVLVLAAALLPALTTAVPGGWPALAARTLGIVALVGGLASAAFRNHWEARRLAVLAKQAELDMLHARIRPHFLFNTLNTATALVHSRPDDAERVLLDLSDLFRAALGKNPSIPLDEELALTRRYLGIEASRFGERLGLQWDAPDTLPEILVPTLSIQPLVENAVRHGIEPSVTGGVVSVAVRTTATAVEIEIRNPVAPPGRAVTPGHGVGLRASKARIDAATQGRGGVRLERDGETFVTRVEFPLDAP